MLAVLDDALLTLSRHAGVSDRRARRLTDEVDAWIAVDDLDWPFSFVNVCQALHLDVSCVRSRIDDWRRAALRPVSSAPVATMPLLAARRRGERQVSFTNARRP